MPRLLAFVPALLTIPFLACEPGAVGPEDGCVGGKCDDPREGVDDADLEAFPCDAIFENFSTRRNPDGSEISRFVDRLRDPLTTLAFRGSDCPTSFADIIDTMKQNDSDCDTISGNEDGLATRLVSYELYLKSPPSVGFRAITTKTCGNRLASDLFFSVFDLAADTAELPRDSVEIMARDEATGVYNFYREVDGKIGFFGSGLDYLFDGHGDSVTDINGCGSCHAADASRSGRGNLNMKERATPWMHWEGDFPRNGADAVIERFSETMGVSQGGANLEFLVNTGNNANNEAIINALVAARDYKRLLGPLFCSEQLDVATGDSEQVPSGFLYNQWLHRDDSVSVSAADYESLLVATRASIVGSTTDVDTEFPFAYVARSRDDQGFIQELLARNIIDVVLGSDVLAVDFTRPAFSDARCDLLEFAPTADQIAPADLNAKTIADAFIDNLSAAATGTPAAQLLAHLEAARDGASFDHRRRARLFTSMCQDVHDNGEKVVVEIGGGATRSVSRFQLDAMRIRSRDIHLATRVDRELNDASGSDLRARPVFEFARTFATDEIRVTASAGADDVLAVHPDAHFNPIFCTLSTEYVPVPKLN